MSRFFNGHHFYLVNWNYALPSEVRKLRQLEEENARLRRLVADLSLDKEMLQEVIRKKL
jgi:cell division protein FtsB